MQLKLQRSQRTTGMISSKVAFALNARVQLMPEEEELVRKYALGKTTVYDSEARKKHSEDMSYQAEAMQGTGLGQTLFRAGKMGISAAMRALTLHVTIDSLVEGHHIETKSLDELLGAETAIREACQRVRLYLDTAATFDGSEEVVEI